MARHRHISAKVTSIVILCLSAVLILLSQAFAATGVPAAGQNPHSQGAHLAQIAGQVSVARAGGAQRTKASANSRLAPGDRLYTDNDGQVELQLGSTVIRAGHSADLSVTALTDTIARFNLAQGTLHVRTFSLPAGNTVEVDTPNGTITVMQAGDFRIDCYTGDGGTMVTVDSGEVQLSGPSLSESLGSNQSVRLAGANPITATALTMPGKDPFDIWSRQRDRELLSLPLRH